MRVPAVVVHMHERWVANGYPDYPALVPLVLDSTAVLAAIAIVVQRSLSGDWLSASVLAVVALLPWISELRGRVAPWPVFLGLNVATTVVLVVHYPVAYDVAPLMLVIMVGHVGACLPAVRSALTEAGALLAVGLLAGFGSLPGAAAAIWLPLIVVGWDVGFIVRFQQQRLDEQVRLSAIRETRAAEEERRRIAREVHDLVAHSLSVTLLHLTAARRDLEEDGATGADLAEVVDSLREAERVGRQAMQDVRATVGLLGGATGSTGATDATRPTPTLADVPGLVDTFRAAGLVVAYDVLGPVADVPATTGSCLFRVVQESLANVAKHAPTSSVTVRMDLGADPGELVVRSRLPGGAVPRGASGSGVRGMVQRAELVGGRLTAGPEGGDWVVRLVLPRGDVDSAASHCPLPRVLAAGRTTLLGEAR